MSEEEREIINGWFLLTDKPVIYAANIADSEIGQEESAHVKAVREIAQAEGSQVFTISAQIEEEIAQMEPEEKDAFLNELGLGQSGLDRLIAACYTLLGLISFLTAGADECRAWTIRRGTKAPQAAGKIHTDFERGFIRAEVVAYEDLKAQGGMAACRDKGLVRSEGKDYVNARRRRSAVPLQRIRRGRPGYVEIFLLCKAPGAHGLEGHVENGRHAAPQERQEPPVAAVRHAALRAEVQRRIRGLQNRTDVPPQRRAAQNADHARPEQPDRPANERQGILVPL